MATEDKLNKMDRRSFIKIASIAGAAGLSYPLIGCSESATTSSEDDSSSYTSSINQDTANAMMNEGIKELTQLTDVGDAWKSIMSGITASSVIAIKVNCRSASLPTHVEVVNAVIEGLKQMSFAGVTFPENNIVIYDNFKAYLSESGYTINTSSNGVRCYTATNYSSTSYSVNGISQKLCTLVTDTADFLINIAVLKNHNSMAGATLCMKNHFGTCQSPRSMHINYGDPYIGALNAVAPIKNKQCINILDAIYGAHEGGPYGGPTFVANKILMSQDIVAVDYLGREILETNGSSTVSWATYIDSAANYGIGTNNPDEMEIVNITNPTGTMATNTIPAVSGSNPSRVVIVEDETASTV